MTGKEPQRVAGTKAGSVVGPVMGQGPGGRLTQDKVTRSIREHSGVAYAPKLDDQSGCGDPPNPSFSDNPAVGPSVVWADEIYPMN